MSNKRIIPDIKNRRIKELSNTNRNNKKQTAILKAAHLIATEYMDAKRKFPVFNSLHEAYAVIKEELDEFWEVVKGKDTNRTERAKEEILQAAAMCLGVLVEFPKPERTPKHGTWTTSVSKHYFDTREKNVCGICGLEYVMVYGSKLATQITAAGMIHLTDGLNCELMPAEDYKHPLEVYPSGSPAFNGK